MGVGESYGQGYQVEQLHHWVAGKAVLLAMVFLTGWFVDGRTDETKSKTGRYSAIPALTSNFDWHTHIRRCGYGEMVS